MHFLRAVSIMRTYGLSLSQRLETAEKLYTSNTFLKMAGGRMHTPHPSPLSISYRNHQKSLAYFSHLAPLILFFFTKRQSQKGEAMAQCPPGPLPKYASA